MNVLSLLELNSLVRRGIEQCLPDTYWVQAELSDVRENASGHCYFELIEKHPTRATFLAKARGMIWANSYLLLKSFFEESTGLSFSSGIKVLVEVSVQFHELYGYSLVVQNIDPSYTLGDLAKKRKEILKQLEEEGVLNLNKELDFPKYPQRIAVISSKTAAGLGDFLDQLKNNSHRLKFKVDLFPAVMQGEGLEESVLAAMDAILKEEDQYDLVVLIRGGGAASDLTGFDTYLLAASCAQYPIPIVAGIGHERDETVLDSIVHTSVKTPTAAAEFLIRKLWADVEEIWEKYALVIKQVENKLKTETQRLSQFVNALSYRPKEVLVEHSHQLSSLLHEANTRVNMKLLNYKHQLQLLSQRLEDVSPLKLLEKGYSLTFHHGKRIKGVTKLKEGDLIHTYLSGGVVCSTIDEIQRKNGKKEL